MRPTMFTPAAHYRTRFPWTGLMLLVWLPAIVPVRAELTISEILASNVATLADDDGTFSDWVEIHNPDAAPVDLNGWYLTDSASARTKWQFPQIMILPGEFLVVFASNKDRRDPTRPLHTNFALSAGGEYLGLVRPDGVTVASEFAPSFPAQTNDVAYGRVILADGTLQTGFLRRPTPGAPNGGAEALLVAERVSFSHPSGLFSGTVTVQLSGAEANQQIRHVMSSGPGAAQTEVTTTPPPVYRTVAIGRHDADQSRGVFTRWRQPRRDPAGVLSSC